MELILVVVISAGMAENSQNGVSRSLITRDVLNFNIASAICHFHYNIPAIRPLWCHSSKMAHPYGLRKRKRLTSDTYRYTELLKFDQIGKIPTYMEET